MPKKANPPTVRYPMRTVAPLNKPDTPSSVSIVFRSRRMFVERFLLWFSVWKVICLVFKTSSGVVKKPEVAPAIEPLTELTIPGITVCDSAVPSRFDLTLMLTILSNS